MTHSRLDESREAVHIGDITRVLQLYCTALSEKQIGVKSIEDAPEELVHKGRHYPLTDGKTVFLPESISKYPLYEDNFREYKVLAAHQAGYIEFGTFDLDLNELRHNPVLSSTNWSKLDSVGFGSHYELFFKLFNDRELARDIFYAVEDGRVDFLLSQKYRGLAIDIKKIVQESLKERPDPESMPLREALIENLIQFSMEGQIETLPYGLQPLVRRFCEILSGIFVPGASVADSALATASIYILLESIPNILISSALIPETIQGLEGLPFGGENRVSESGSQPGDENYEPAMPVSYRGQTCPDLVQFELAIDILNDSSIGIENEGMPLSKEMLEELLKSGAKIEISQMTAEELTDNEGLFVTDLDGLSQEKIRSLSSEEKEKLSDLLQRVYRLKSKDLDDASIFYYDEWDYLIGGYRPHWCKLKEIPLEQESSSVVAQILRENWNLIASVRRHFQRIRPEMLHKVKRLPSGEDIDIDDAIEYEIDRKAGLSPSEMIYQQRERRMRDVATAFLLDMSASTNEYIEDEPVTKGKAGEENSTAYHEYLGRAMVGSMDPYGRSKNDSKRVIDIEREALVIMAEALEGLGDEYAIYGFSGTGRDNAEFLTIKDFSEKYSERARCRIGAIKPRTGTRMGPAIRHTLEKLSATGCRMKVLILLSDGYPQDVDYGPDRMSRDYGLHDTMVALEEANSKNIHTFLVTVDQAGNDYLQEMCVGENYLVVNKPSELPKILPQVYKGLTV